LIAPGEPVPEDKADVCVTVDVTVFAEFTLTPVPVELVLPENIEEKVELGKLVEDSEEKVELGKLVEDSKEELETAKLAEAGATSN